MRPVKPLSYVEALQLLGKHTEKRWVTVLSTVLGVSILAAGVLIPTGAVAAAFVWGAIDQKNEAIGLLNKMVNAGVGRLSKVRGRERLELLEAAHAMIVGVALFDAWREELGGLWAELALTPEEQVRLLTEAPGDDLVDMLCAAGVPMPTAASGFSRNLGQTVRPYLQEAVAACQRFFAGLAAGERHAWLSSPEVAESVVAGAIGRYREHYLQLTIDVREFYVLVMLDGQGEIFDALADVVGLVQNQRGALAGLTELLMLPGAAGEPGRRSRLVRDTNIAVLSQPPIADDVLRYVPGLRVPTIGECYVTPDYRFAVNAENARFADDEWWRQQPLYTNLVTFLAAHFASPVSTTSPLLVLGDPGSGKSMLTKVLAAQLPADRFLVVRVQLRDVTANAAVHVQVQEALDRQVHGRARWEELADESQDIIRVVVFDGLDELLQSADVGRDYLRDVREFQASEAAVGSPVCAVVTSRTLVTARTWLPSDCLAVKIADFDDEQIVAWLDAWRRANARAAASGAIRLLDSEAALRLPDLSRQPLLLLLIALYAADPTAPELADETRSPSDLYRALIENFIRREIDQQARRIAPGNMKTEIGNRLWQLGITALAMFNRRAPYVLDTDLANDLAAMRAGDAHEVIEKFFFVHAATATLPAGIRSRTSFEFLHSTLGEYLVAATILDKLLNAEDGLLPALLAYRALAAQPRCLMFLQELANGLPPQDRRTATVTAIRLLQAARQLPADAYPAYRPQNYDILRALAAYTANLTLLLACLGGGTIEDTEWRVMARLWLAGLDDESWQALVVHLRHVGGQPRIATQSRGYDKELEAQLLGDEQWLRAAEMIYSLGGFDDSTTLGILRRCLLSTLADRTKRSRIPSTLEILAAHRDERLPPDIRQLAIDLLGFATPEWGYGQVKTAVEIVTAPRRYGSRGVILEKMDYRPLALTVAAHPRLTSDITGLADLVTNSSWSPSPHHAAMTALVNDTAWYQRVRAALTDPNETRTGD